MNFKKTITAALVIAAMAGTVTPVAQNIAPAFNTASITAEAAGNTRDFQTVFMTDSTNYKNKYRFNQIGYAYQKCDLKKKFPLSEPNEYHHVIPVGKYKEFVDYYTKSNLGIIGKTKAGSYVFVADKVDDGYELKIDAFVYVNKYNINLYSKPEANKKYEKWFKKYYNEELRIAKVSFDHNWGYVRELDAWVYLYDVRG